MLRDLLQRASVRRFAGPSSFSAGEDYAAAGTVRVTAQDATTVTAKVQGTRLYDVRLREDDGDLAHECSCPIGQRGNFCKHCVAVAAEVGGWGHASRSRPAVTMDDVRDHLMSWKKQHLVSLIVEQAEEDDGLRNRLLMQVAGQQPGGPDVETFKAALRDAIEPDGFIPWRESYDWYHGVESAMRPVEGLLAEGQAAAVIEICEDALATLDGAGGTIDDSDGHIGTLARRLGDLHVLACKKARPDPVQLGQRLVEFELESDHEAFYEAADRYADVLGEEGLAAYRKALEGRWAAVPPLGPGERDREGIDRFPITHMMERLVRRSGDPDQVAEVMSRDLGDSHDFLQIAKVYREAKRYDDALDWAQRGLAAFPERPGSDLREFAAEELHRRGRHDEAMRLIWAEFELHPGLTGYQLLHKHTKIAKADWPSWSDSALAFLRRDIEGQELDRRDRYRWEGQPDHSRLVEIFLWRKEPETAWLEAQAGGCSRALWMRLAQARQDEHPADAVPVYQREVESLVAAKNNQAYAEARDSLEHIEKVMARMSPHGDFKAYVAEVRARHRIKRNFIALLDKAGWR